jgi:hypothetical protein
MRCLLLLLFVYLTINIQGQSSDYKKFSLEILGGRSIPMNKNMRSFDQNNPKAGFTKIGRNIEMAFGYRKNENTMWRLQGNFVSGRSDWAEVRVEEILEFIDPPTRPTVISYDRILAILNVVLSYRKEYELRKQSQHKYFLGAGIGFQLNSLPYDSAIFFGGINNSFGTIQTMYTVDGSFNISPSINIEGGLRIDLGRNVSLLPQLQIWGSHFYNEPLVLDSRPLDKKIELPLSPIGGIKIFSTISIGLGINF